jgi:MtN3 and saliva related transmembrane protein
MYETKSAQDVSLVTLVQFCAGVTLWVFYGMSIKDQIVVVANAITFVTLVIAILLYIRYHRRMKRSAGYLTAEDW